MRSSVFECVGAILCQQRCIGKVKIQPFRWVGSTSPCLAGGGFTGGCSNDAEDGGRKVRALVSPREPDGRISRGGVLTAEQARSSTRETNGKVVIWRVNLEKLLDLLPF